MIVASALLPAYLWASGRSRGLPVFPLHALAFVWTYALPLVAGQEEIALYETDEIVFAAITVSLYAIAGTIAWYIASRLGRDRARYLVLPEGRGYALLVGSLLVGGVFIMLIFGGLLQFEPGVFGILRSSIIAFASIAFFVLSVRMGRGELVRGQKALFVAAASFFIIMQMSNFFLIGSIISVASALIGYTVGRRRVPWIAIVAALAIFGFLHAGKGEMRERYWTAGGNTVPPIELPIVFAEWIGAGMRELTSAETGLGHQPIYERVSLMHLLLFVQRASPDQVPYLDGATYAIIPRLLVPRIIDPDKPDSHQGTAMLNVEYGIQSQQDTETTVIGWGLLNEGFANFGLGGVVGLGFLIGLVFGVVGSLTAGAPIMSFENLVGVTFAAMAIQSEFTMAVFATALFQSLVALTLLLPFLTRRVATGAE